MGLRGTLCLNTLLSSLQSFINIKYKQKVIMFNNIYKCYNMDIMLRSYGLDDFCHITTSANTPLDELSPERYKQLLGTPCNYNHKFKVIK